MKIMLKHISSLGKILNKSEQKEISGGFFAINRCTTNSDCCGFPNNPSYGYVCTSAGQDGSSGFCAPGLYLPGENPCL